MSYWYLATPYTRYPKGHQAAFDDACAITAELIRAGLKVFCPIAHSHPLVEHGVDGIDEAFWKNFDQPFLEASCGVIVAVNMEGAYESRGIAHEVSEAIRLRKAVFHYTGNDISLEIRALHRITEQVTRTRTTA